jgi:hypothetical protein
MLTTTLKPKSKNSNLNPQSQGTIMKTKLARRIATALLSLSTFTTFYVAQPSTVFAQGTAFTYQGFLTDQGAPASGLYDLQVALVDAAIPDGSPPVAGPLTKDDVSVTNGLFTFTLDFGSAPFDGSDRWLEIAVRSGASAGAYTTLSPRQPITSAPYAIKAANAMTVAMGTISDPSFIGTTSSNAPLDLFVNNQRGLRLEYPTSGTVPNLIGGYSGNSIGSGNAGAIIAGGGSGGTANAIGDYSGFSAIGGGQGNHIASNSWSATIAGGNINDIGVNSDYSAIGGGFDNNIADNSFYATIAGGAINDIGADSEYSAIGGGFDNDIADNSFYATIAGGSVNDIGVNADYSAIGGGNLNNIGDNAQFAMIPGGQNNSVGAGASYALAAGRRAKANHTGVFVWADSQNADFASTAANQFLIRASGGVGIGTAAPQRALQIGEVSVAGSEGMIRLASRTSSGGAALREWELGVPQTGDVATGEGYSFVIRDTTGGGAAPFMVQWGTGNVGLGTTNPGVDLEVVGQLRVHQEVNFVGTKGFSSQAPILVKQAGAAGNEWAIVNWADNDLVFAHSGGLAAFFIRDTDGSQAVTSDRRLKKNIEPVDSRETLEKFGRLAPVRYHFNNVDEKVPRTAGLLAQDVEEVFPELVVEEGGYKAVVYSQFVPLSIAAIQGLNAKLEARNQKSEASMQKLTEELSRRDKEVTRLKEELAELKHLMNKLANTMNGGAR